MSSVRMEPQPLGTENGAIDRRSPASRLHRLTGADPARPHRVVRENLIRIVAIDSLTFGR